MAYRSILGSSPGGLYGVSVADTETRLMKHPAIRSQCFLSSPYISQVVFPAKPDEYNKYGHQAHRLEAHTLSGCWTISLLAALNYVFLELTKDSSRMGSVESHHLVVI